MSTSFTDRPAAVALAEERELASQRLARRAVRGGAVLVATRLLVQVVAWGVTLTVARLLTPYDYGVMSVGVVFICLADMLSEAGVGRALIQKAELTRDDLAAAFTINLLLATALYGLLFGTAGPAARYFEMPALATMLPVLGLMVLLAPFRAVAFALLDRELRMERQAAVHAFFSAFHAAIVLSLAFLGYGYWSLVVGAVVGRVFEVLGLYLATRWTPRLTWTPWRHGEILRFGMNVSFSGLLMFFYNNSLFVILGKVVGPVTLGYFSLAFQIVSLPMQKLTVNANQVVYPVFCRLREDRAKLRDWYLRLTVLLGFLGVPTAFGLVLGAKWLPAVLPFRLLSLVGILMIYAASLPPMFDAIGRPDITLRYSATCAVLFPVASYFAAIQGAALPETMIRLAGAYPALHEFLVPLVAQIGPDQGALVGVCLAWLVLYPLIIVGLVALTRGVTGVGVLDLARPQWPVALAAACMVVALYHVRSAVPAFEPAAHAADAVRARLLLRLVLSVLAGGAVYAGVILLVGRDRVLADVRALVREVRNKTPETHEPEALATEGFAEPVADASGSSRRAAP
jgi:teichuronic acid exporter